MALQQTGPRSAVAFAIGLTIASDLRGAAVVTRITASSRTDCAVVEAELTPAGRVRSARITKSAGTRFDRRALAFVKTRRYPVPKGNTKVLYLSVGVCPHELR